MFRGDLIIDGYNVLYAADLVPPSGGPHGLERARRSLLRLISGRLTPRERHRTTVVFDAPEQTMGPSPPHEVHQLLVMFADRDGDADAMIERLIRKNSAPRRLCVVSSDRRLQKAARRRRAGFLDSETFLKRLARRASRAEHRGEEEPAAKRSGRLSPGEVDAWLRVFEDIEDVRLPSSTCAPNGRPNDPAKSHQPAPTAARRRDAGTNGHHPATTRSDNPNADNLDEISFWESRIAELDTEDGGRRD